MVGLPGSGKSVVGRRLAGRHGAAFIDLDERIEATDGRTIPAIFEADGEPAFRALERAAIADLGPPDRATTISRVISTGGGAVVDPRNRWSLLRGRRSVWLDGRPEVLAQRLRRSPHVRPLVMGRDPIGAIRELAVRRERFYAAADVHQSGVSDVHAVVDVGRRPAGCRRRRHGGNDAAPGEHVDRTPRHRRSHRGRRHRLGTDPPRAHDGRSLSLSPVCGPPTASA